MSHIDVNNFNIFHFILTRSAPLMLNNFKVDVTFGFMLNSLQSDTQCECIRYFKIF